MICMTDRQTAVVGDWSGALRIFRFNSPESAQIFGYQIPILSGPDPIYSLHVEPSRRETCVIVSRVAHFLLWQIGTDNFQKVFAQAHGPVNCASYSPDGSRLAVGIGFYPLNPAKTSEARLEIWSLKNSHPCCESEVLLPGVCVDSVAWATGGSEIACVTGLRSQQDGFLVVLTDAGVPRRFGELGTAMNHAVVYLEDNRVLVQDGKKIACLSVSSRAVLWEFPTDNECRMAFDQYRNEIALNSGSVLEAEHGRLVRELQPLEECSAVAVRPNGGYVGISKGGTIRVWD